MAMRASRDRELRYVRASIRVSPVMVASHAADVRWIQMEPNERPDGLARTYRRARWGSIAAAWGAIFVFDSTRHCLDACLAGRSPSPSWLIASGSSLSLWAA